MQQNLSRTCSGPHLIEYGLYWSQYRQNFVKICRLQWCILDSDRRWACITLPFEGTGDVLQVIPPICDLRVAMGPDIKMLRSGKCYVEKDSMRVYRPWSWAF